MADTIKEKLNQFIADTLFYDDLPGIAIGVTVGQESVLPCGGLEYCGCAGYRDFEKKEPMTEDAFFHFASISKLFVGTAILQLVETGSLKLTDRLTAVLPWLLLADPRAADITIEQMLTHTSGLGDVSDYEWDRPQIGENALRAYVTSEQVTAMPLLWAPGTGSFRYSNIAYEMLGCIIAEASGMPFEAYIKKHIFEPLHMEHSTFLTFERTAGSLALADLAAVGMAMPHYKNDTKHIVRCGCYPYNRAHGPSSTLTSNLQDIRKFACAHLLEGQQRLLRKETYASVRKEYALVPNNGERIGLSCFIRVQDGYTLYGHEGSDDGFRSSFWICPELELSICVLANMSGAPVKKINKKVFTLLLA